MRVPADFVDVEQESEESAPEIDDDDSYDSEENLDSEEERDAAHDFDDDDYTSSDHDDIDSQLVRDPDAAVENFGPLQ